jgi:hypothetical protein
MTASSSLLSVSTRPHLEKFFAQVDPVRARLIFAIDATASRQATWDMATALTAEMFAAVASDKLETQLVYFRGDHECVNSRWMSEARSLTNVMSTVTCRSGLTQIRRVLSHANREDQRRKVNACVLISDSCEETSTELYIAARELNNVPVFMFQEGGDEGVAAIYRTIANITGGAYSRFDAGSAQRLAELLKAVAAFAVGGIKALADQNSEASKLLLTQLKK